jgi:hypothetical protein
LTLTTGSGSPFFLSVCIQYASTLCTTLVKNVSIVLRPV